jgi:hypothetical protein
MQLDLKAFKQKLQSPYFLQTTIPKLIDDESIFVQSMNDYYIKLLIIFKDNGSSDSGSAGVNKVSAREFLSNYEAARDIKASTAIDNLFDPDATNPKFSKVLILGEVGVDKTTLLHCVLYKWSSSFAIVQNKKFIT